MPEVDPFFAELDAEIAEATKKSKLRADAATLKRQAANMRLSAAVRARAAEEYRAIQAIVEAEMWQIVRGGALFAEQTCDGCGSIHYNFLQYMQEEVKIRDARTRRWVRVPLPPESCPLDTIIQPLTTHICSDCCEDHGFDVRRPTIQLMPRDGSLTVSSTYIQGDINDSTTQAGSPESVGGSAT